MLDDTAPSSTAVIEDPDPVSVARPQARKATRLTSQQRAAIILVLLGPEASAPIVENMDNLKMREFIRALEGLDTVPRGLLIDVISDFVDALDARKGELRAGPKRSRAIAEDILKAERVAKLLNAPVVQVNLVEAEVWESVNTVPINRLSGYLAEQRPEIGVIILSQLQADIVAEVLDEMPDTQSVDFVSRLSTIQPAKPHVMKAISNMVQRDLLIDSGEESNDDALAYVGDILGIISRSKRESVLAGLEKTAPDQLEKIKAKMLTFEDIPVRLPTSAVQIIFKDFPKLELLKALKAGMDAAPDTVEFLFGNISQRMADQYKEEISDLSEMTEKVADKAIAKLIGFLLKQDREGRITLIKVATEPVE